MDRKLVGEPGVSAFLRSVRQNLDGHISRMKPNYTTYLYYDHTQDLEKLNQKLVLFQDLLVDGEARRLGEECVDEWMDDIKHLLYDIEDILDDLQSVRNDQVRVHELYITSREKEKSVIKILNRTDVLRDRAKDLELKRGRGYGLKVSLRTSETSSMVDKSEIMHGRDEEKNAIVKRLLKVDDEGKENYDVLCIVGMGGLGKTTLAQQVFHDPEVVKHFGVKSWVCISNVFDVAKATKELIMNSCPEEDGNPVHQSSLESLQSRLRVIVEKNKFLFVLDDVWSSKEWERMKAPFSLCANGSKILVTTRNIKIAHAFGNMDPYPLKGLNLEKCKEIFRDKAFRDDKGREQKKEDLVEKIVKACKGVPLVVKVIGSMFRFSDAEKWQALSKNVASWVNENDEIHPAIRFSYYDLPAFLKRCFEYLAMFPPDYEFDQDDIVRLWIADGLVQEVDGRKAEDIGAEYYNELKARSLIQEGEWKNDKMHDIVHDLATVVSRKFCYKENSKNSPARVRHAFVDDWEEMHSEFLSKAPCLRTLIVKNSGDRNLVQIIIRSCKMLRTLKIGDDYDVLYDCNLSFGGSVIDHLTHIRYLSFAHSDIHLPDSLCMLNNLLFLVFNHSEYLKNLPKDMKHLSNLRFLCVRGSLMLSLSLMDPESICSLSELQVLDLCGCKSLEVLPKDIGNLRSLRLLDLGDTSISSLPESICALSELQTLCLGGCQSLTELPKDIGNLRSLQNLNLDGTAISSLPKSIRALSELQILNLNGCGSLTELPKHIGNLRKLQHLNLRGNAISSLPESICGLSELQTLLLVRCKSLTKLPKDIGNLESLHIIELVQSSISSLPESVCSLGQLHSLRLSQCGCLKQLPKDIGNLRSLRELDLSFSSISSLPESICDLNQLHVLNLACCKSLHELPKDIGNLRNLRTLFLHGCEICVPVSILNVRGLHNNHFTFHIGRFPYQVKNEEGFLPSLSKFMRFDMVTIGGVEDALMADLKSKNIRSLKLCCCSESGDDEEMEMKIIEALEPHHALQFLELTNYQGDKLPAWIMPSNICYSNLRKLEMEGFDKICEMVDMEFVSLKVLNMVNCPKLKKVLMATPKLDELYLKNCGELEAVDLLPSLSDKDGMHSIVSQLWDLRCEYNIFEYFFEKLKTLNSKWDKLRRIRLSGGGRRFASLPGGWPSMMESVRKMYIWDIPAGKFQLLPDGDESAFPPSLRVLYINNCRIEEQPPHHSYSITWERKDESEEEEEWEQEEDEEEEESEEESSETE